MKNQKRLNDSSHRIVQKGVSFLTLLTILTLLLTGCSKTPNTFNNEENNPQESRENVLYVFEDYSRPLSAVKTIAKRYRTETKSSTMEISSIKYITSTPPSRAFTKNTTTAQQDTIMYVINYANNGGYAILTADYRTSPIVAFSDKGSLDPKEIDNPGFEFAMQRAKLAYWEQIAHFDSLKNTLSTQEMEQLKRRYAHLRLYNNSLAASSPQTKNDFSTEPDTMDLPAPPDNQDSSVVVKKILPLYAKYGQKEPFNKEAPILGVNLDGPIHAQAGCVAVAIGQIMAYNKHPALVAGRSLRWNQMNIDKYSIDFFDVIDDIAYLLRKVGDRVGNDWGIAGTGADITDVGPTFNHFGYSFQHGNWNNNLIFGSIDHNAPVYASGISDAGGHAWVVYGYLSDRSTMWDWVWNSETQEYEAMNHTTSTLFYVQCNWGWEGDFDNLFDSRYLGVNGYLFDKKLYLVYNIIPK